VTTALRVVGFVLVLSGLFAIEGAVPCSVAIAVPVGGLLMAIAEWRALRAGRRTRV
jgi:hypothetical protein